jgi:hypothetical protein
MTLPKQYNANLIYDLAIIATHIYDLGILPTHIYKLGIYFASANYN